ncbi:MAG: amidohydrolase family protein [Bryobacteraceae bacterium]|nr:amidohydrolase family protein [Bryobacteraceae bacterium]
MRFGLVMFLAGAASAAEVIAITNGRVVSVSSAPMDRATVIITDGKISAVGSKVSIPTGARRIDATGLSVYPGWIDGWTRVGLAEISSVSGSVDTTELGPFNPAAQAWIAVNPHSEMIKTARVNGVTSALVAPSGGRISGTASALNLLGKYPDQMALLKNAGMVVNLPAPPTGRRGEGGGDTPAAGNGGSAENEAARRRAEDLEKLKQYLREAKRYSDMRARSANTPASAIDSALEAMLPVVRGERPIIVPADTYRDIKAAVDFASEFGLKLLIAGGADAWKLTDLLVKNKVGVLYSAVHELPRSADDPYDVTFSTPETLRRAGVPFAIVSGATSDVRNLPYRAAMAAAYGLEREDALKALTLWPAQILGVADKVGSIESGKLANLLVVKGDPLDIRSEIRYVFVEGREVPAGNRNLQLFDEFRQPSPTR